MKSKDDTTTGRDSWRSARGKETVVLTTPRPRGRGKRRIESGGGIAKRPRMESSSSERRDESEESRSGTRDRPGRGGRRVARPSTPPHRPPPPSISPRRSPRLTTSAVRDLRNLPLAAKIDRRTAHSRSVSGDEHGPGAESLVTECIRPQTVEPGSTVKIKRAYAAAADELQHR